MSRVSAALVWAIAAALATAGPAAAQPDPSDPDEPILSSDYELDSDSWNGLKRLESIARGFGLTVEATDRIEWDELGSEDILFIIYPSARIEPGHLAAFIRNGGRVLIADDFGHSTEALGRLGVLRSDAVGVDAHRFYDDLSYAPIARPWRPNHPLALGVSELVTNHPAVLSEASGPEMVLGFGDNEGVVAAGALGQGRFVVLSDPSVLINRMLEFDGNLQFAINLVRFLRRPDRSRRLVILSEDFLIFGEPSGWLDDGTVRGKVDNMMADFNGWLDERNDYLLTQEGVQAVSIVIAMLIAGLGLLALPFRRRSSLDGAWTRARGDPGALDDFETLVGHFDDRRNNASHLLPAAILRDTVNARLGRLLDRPEPLYTISEAQLYAEIAARERPEAVAAIQAVYRRLKTLPSRVQAASPWSVGYLSRREFELLYDDVGELDRTLGGD